MTFGISRRNFLAGSSALVGLGVAGLRPAFAQSDQLRLTFWGGQNRADRTYGVVDLFSEATGTQIDGEFLGWNDYWPRLATQTAGGNAPDIIQMDYRYIVEYASRNAITSLEPFLGNQLALDDFDEDQVEGGRVNGDLYGVSLGANTVAMMVNTAAFEEASVDLPTRETTYNDIRTMGEAFRAANIRNGMRLIADGSGSEPALDNWVRQRGGALYNADGTLAITAEDMVEWFTMWAEFREAGVCVTAEDQALDTGAVENTMLVLGRSALMHSNSNQLVAFQSLVQDDIVINAYPRIAPGAGGGHYRKPSMFFSVAEASQNKERAAEFLSFFVNDLAAAEILEVERGIPASAGVREAIAPNLDEKSQLALNFVAELGDLLGPIPPPPPAAAGEIDISLLRTLSQEVAFGARSPEDAGPYFATEAAAILARSSGG